MVEESKHDQCQWSSPAEQQAQIIDIANNISLMSEPDVITDDTCLEQTQLQPQPQHSSTSSDDQLGLVERSLSAAGAAFLSAVLVNPLDVVKVFIFSLFYFSLLVHLLQNDFEKRTIINKL